VVAPKKNRLGGGEMRTEIREPEMKKPPEGGFITKEFGGR
jgi:hypothetical protein